MSDIPEVVRNKAAVAGQTDWVTDLPRLVSELADLWQLDIGDAYSEGTEAHVVRATRRDGTAAVLKMLVPREAAMAHREAEVLRLADGDGCARLLEFDASRQAMLLERLGPSMFSLGIPVAKRHELLCDAATRLWRSARDADFPTGEWKARWLREWIRDRYETLGRPCDAEVIEHAVECAERRRAAHDPDRAVLVHGDVHQWNALRADDGSFKLVDPDGLLAEPEYDLGILMREDPLELMADDPFERAARLATMTGLDPTAIAEWGVVERVSTGLMCLEIGMDREGDEMLRAAEYVTAAERR